MHELFRKFALTVSHIVGSAPTFAVAVTIISIWLMTGPLFNFSNTWQLFINTTTTIVTFLMVFLIQNTQNRDSKALHIKLDELLRSTKTARNDIIDIEEVTDEELDKLQAEFKVIHNRYHQALQKHHHRKVTAMVHSEQQNKPAEVVLPKIKELEL